VFLVETDEFWHLNIRFIYPQGICCTGKNLRGFKDPKAGYKNLNGETGNL
jgi:hypothetical protein